jgi:hypothetical protein
MKTTNHINTVDIIRYLVVGLGFLGIIVGIIIHQIA